MSSELILLVELLIAWQLISMFLMPHFSINLPFGLGGIKSNYVRGNRIWQG